MRRFIAIIITAVLALSTVSGLFVFADSSISEALESAKKELYGLYTPQSALFLRDTYNRAIGTNDASLADELLTAKQNLIPLENYTRIPLAGFGGISADDIAAMKYCEGTVSASEGIIRLLGEGSLRYTNADDSGIVGPSPFAAPISDCDGFVIKISADTDCSLDLQIGRRGSDDDCVFSLGDIAVTAGERYYFFDFSLFGNIPLDGSLNYVSLRFNGANEVSFSDLHAAADTMEAAKSVKYTETLFSGIGFNSKKYYKILQKDSNLALTLLEKPNSFGDIAEFSENDPDNDAQLWSISLIPDSNNEFFIINKHFARALGTANQYTLALESVSPDLTSPTQRWRFTYSKSKGYTVGIRNVCKLSYIGTKPKLFDSSSAAKNFDIVEVSGNEWNLVWSDEFNSNTLNRDVWFPMEGKSGKDTEPYYSRNSSKNIYLENGNLILKTIKEEYEGMPATAAHINTEDKVLFGYGRFEMRAKMPEGNKVWPAFWLMGDDEYWPYSGEIDILEMIGSDAYDDYFGSKKAIATFHYANSEGLHDHFGGNSGGILINDKKLSDDYHIYAVEWEKDQLRWYFDDFLYLTLNIDTPDLKNALQENPMYMRLSVAMEGAGDFKLPENYPDETVYAIDYVRYYRDSSAAKSADRHSYTFTRNSASLNKELMGYVNTNAVSAKHDLLVYANSESHLMVYDAKTLSAKGYSKPSTWSYCYAKTSALSGDGSTVVFGQEGKLTVDDIALKSPLSFTFYSYSPVVALNNDGSRIYAGGVALDSNPDYCNYFRVFNSKTAAEISKEYTGSWVDSITVSADDTYAYGCYDGTVRIRSKDNTPIAEFELDERIIYLLFSADSNKLYVADGANNIYVYSISDNNLSLLTSSPDGIYQLALSPDGGKLAAACGDACARVYDTSNGKLLCRPELGKLVVTNVIYSLDGNMLILSGTDGEVGVFRADDGLPMVLLTDNEIPTCYNTVVASSDNSRVIATRTCEAYFSKIVGWRLPSEITDFFTEFPVIETEYTDEYLYTAESYERYIDALNKVSEIRNNRYSTQEQIDNAASELQKAFEALEKKPDYMKGDFDFDGKITVADALAALRIAAKMADSTDETIAIGDIDKDGKITVSDSLAILRVAAKMADSL